MLTEANFSEGQQKLIDALYGGNILAVAKKGFGKFQSPRERRD